MNKTEKINKVLNLFKEGKETERVAEEVGYSSPNSLSRFMLRHHYRWDRDMNNYVPDKSKEQSMEPMEEENNTEVLQRHHPDVALLENPDIIRLLNQSEALLALVDKPVVKPEYDFWRNAQKYSRTRKARISTSLRLPNDLNEELTAFRNKTHLTQTQVICMALEYFMENFKSEMDSS